MQMSNWQILIIVMLFSYTYYKSNQIPEMSNAKWQTKSLKIRIVARGLVEFNGYKKVTSTLQVWMFATMMACRYGRM